MTKKSHYIFADKLVKILDTKFNVFGLKFGIDPFLDLYPVFGNIIGVGISCYVFWIAYQFSVPQKIYWRMAWNIVVDFIMGAIPFAGFFLDLFYRANAKNLALLTPYVDPDVLEGVVVDGVILDRI